MVEPQHIKAKKGDIAENVVMSGDPARVKQLSEYLVEARMVNENRGFLAYSGRYRDKAVTVVCHGIGSPSIALVTEELILHGAKKFIRLGTAGSFIKELKIGEVVIPNGAAYIGGTLKQYVPDSHLTPVPDFYLTRKLVDQAESAGLRFMVGPVFSSDAFHAEDENFVSKWAGRGFLAVEMECATLFALGLMRKVKTASLLLISDNLAEMTHMADAAALRPYVEKCSKTVFEAITDDHT
jgi:5'-methylthioadenosine phosphorylase